MCSLRFALLMALALGQSSWGCSVDEASGDGPVVGDAPAGDVAVGEGDAPAGDGAVADGGATDISDDGLDPVVEGPYSVLVDTLMPSCTGCHGDGTDGTSSCSYPAACFLNGEAALGQTSVMPGCPANSTIAECSLARIGDGSMPPDNTNPPAGDAAKDALQAWIDAQ